MKTLAGKKALVTGAASGIGREIALELARHQAAMSLWDIDEPGLAETAERVRALGAEVHLRRCDLADAADVSAAVAETIDRWGGVDILVNNAGVAYYGPTERMTGEVWDWVLRVNLLAAIQLIRELLPGMLDRGSGHVLNVSSVGGLVAQTRLAAYHATKFALVGLTEALRAEYDHRGVGFSCLCPGLTRTPFFDHAVVGRKRRRKAPPRWLTIESDRVARAAVKAVRKNRGLVLVGGMAHVLWIAKRISPRLLDYVNRFRRTKRKPAAGGHD